MGYGLMKSLALQQFVCPPGPAARQTGVRRNVFIGFLGMFLVITPRGVLAESLLEKEGLAEDVKLLRRAIGHLHPGLYRYNTPEGIESAFRNLESAFSRPRTLRGAFLALSSFTAKIRCGHTYPNFWNQSDAAAREIWGGDDKLPFLFRWDGNRMIVTASADDRLRPGDEILELNGESPASIAAGILPLIKADGANDGNRWAQLELRGDTEHEAWDIYQPILSPPGYTVKLPGEGDETVEYTLHPLSRAERARRLGIRTPTVEEQWKYEVLDGRLAHLRLGTFAVYNSKFDWKAFLADTFADIHRRGLRHVALDIRGNAGGSDEILVVLANYIVWQPAVMPGAGRLVRYERVPADLRPYLTTWDERFYDRGELPPAGEGNYLLQEAERTALEPTPQAHIARYYLLTDAHNSSATFTLAQFLKDNKLATLIGETTGGNQRGINGGNFLFLKLPYSGIEIDIPLIAYMPVDARPDQGVAPDIPTSARHALAEARRLAARN